jgi:DNA-binding CsgD family transcriptional regulator
MRTIYLSVLLLFCANMYAQNSIQFMKDTHLEHRIENIQDAKFKPFTNNNFGLDNGVYWFKISGRSNNGNVLHIPSAHVNDLKLFSASKKQIEEISYTRYPSYHLDEFEEYPVYLYVNFDKEAYFPIQITSEEEFAKANQQTLFKLGSYYGFAIMVIIINLMCFFLFDEKVFLYYSAVLTMLTLSFFYSDGLFRLMGYDNTFTNIYLEPILHTSLALFAAHFATKFLKLDDLMPKLRWITLGLISAGVVSFISYWLTNNWLFAAIGNAFIWAVLLNYLIAGAKLFKQKVYARFYVVAYSLLFVLMVDFFVLTGFGITFLGITPVHLKTAGILEMLVLTYAIMYRMRAIKEENELMQIEMRLYLRRIELLRSPDNIQMVDDLYLENLINLHDLSNLETKILQYISKGKDNAKIAIKLNITEKEVEKITKQLYKKLDISEQIQEDKLIIDEQPDYVYN